MKISILFSTILLLNSCASLNDSMMLGGALGAMSGAMATNYSNQKIGRTASTEELNTSAATGIAIGLITAFFVHKDIQDKRDEFYKSGPEIYFGDLPPSPFIMTPSLKKKGVK